MSTRNMYKDFIIGFVNFLQNKVVGNKFIFIRLAIISHYVSDNAHVLHILTDAIDMTVITYNELYM